MENFQGWATEDLIEALVQIRYNNDARDAEEEEAIEDELWDRGYDLINLNKRAA